jgi:hypothetical protein
MSDISTDEVMQSMVMGRSMEDIVADVREGRMPVFEVRVGNPRGEHKHYKIYADGRIEGFGSSDVWITNRLRVLCVGFSDEQRKSLARGLMAEELTKTVVVEEACKHDQGTEFGSRDDHTVCKVCGAIHTDYGQSWGVARNMWFKSYAEAEFYREHGRRPE